MIVRKVTLEEANEKAHQALEKRAKVWKKVMSGADSWLLVIGGKGGELRAQEEEEEEEKESNEEALAEPDDTPQEKLHFLLEWEEHKRHSLVRCLSLSLFASFSLVQCAERDEGGSCLGRPRCCSEARDSSSTALILPRSSGPRTDNTWVLLFPPLSRPSPQHDVATFAADVASDALQRRTGLQGCDHDRIGRLSGHCGAPLSWRNGQLQLWQVWPRLWFSHSSAVWWAS